MAMALFAIAGVALAQAMNLVALGVAEGIEEAELREDLRAHLLEASRDPRLEEGVREIAANERGIAFRITVEKAGLANAEARTLDNLFEVTVTALQGDTARRGTELESASTLVHPAIF